MRITLILIAFQTATAIGQTKPILKSCYSPEGKYDDACAEKIFNTLERIAVRKAFENAVPFYDEVIIDFTAYSGDSIQINSSQSLYSEKLKKAAILYLNQLKNSIQFPEREAVNYQWKFNTSKYTEPFRAMELQAHQSVAPLSFSQNKSGKLFSLKNNTPLQYRLVNYRIYRVLKENGIDEIFSGSVNFKNGKPVYLEIELGFLTRSHTDMVSNILASSFTALQDQNFRESEDFSIPFTYDPFENHLDRWIYLLKYQASNKGWNEQAIALLALHEESERKRVTLIDSLSTLGELKKRHSFRLFNDEISLQEVEDLTEASEILTSDHATHSIRKHPVDFILTDFPPIWPGCEELENHPQKSGNCFMQMIRAHFTRSEEFQLAMSSMPEGHKAYLSILFSKDGSVNHYTLFGRGEISETLKNYVEKRVAEMPKVIPARLDYDFVKTSLTVPLW